MPEDHDIQSWQSFSLGYRSVLAHLSPVQRGIMLRAIVDPTPGLATFLSRDVRNRALCMMAGHFEGTVSAVSKQMATAIAFYASTAWLRERDVGPSAEVSALRALLFEILFANAGATLSWRRILDIIEK